jgi:hypothetical protein
MIKESKIAKIAKDELDSKIRAQKWNRNKNKSNF